MNEDNFDFDCYQDEDGITVLNLKSVKEEAPVKSAQENITVRKSAANMEMKVEYLPPLHVDLRFAEMPKKRKKKPLAVRIMRKIMQIIIFLVKAVCISGAILLSLSTIMMFVINHL